MNRTTRGPFLLTYAVLMAIAFADWAIRSAGDGSVCLSQVGLVALASSVPAVLLASTIFLAGNASLFLLVPVVAWTVVCMGAEVFLRHYFIGRNIVGEQFMVALVTLSWERAVAFVSNEMSLLAIGLVVLGFLALLALVAWLTSLEMQPVSLRSFMAGVLLFGSMALLLPQVVLSDHLSKAVFDHPFLKCFNVVSLYQDLRTAGRPIIPGRYRCGGGQPTVVFVIGESSTRSHWSLFGYPRMTTPRLAAMADELVVFSNVTAQAGFTPYALRDLLTSRQSRELVSLPSVAASGGYEVGLVSAQSKWGMYDGADELLFAATGNRQYLSELVAADSPDDAVIPFVKSFVHTASNALLFVHTNGSHTPWAKRSPASFVRYKPGFCDSTVSGLSLKVRENVNSYDNSVLFTDSVVADIIEAVRSLGRPSAVIYASDHGETPRTFSRDLKSAAMFQVPVLFWFSPEYHASYRDRIRKVKEKSGKALKSKDLFPVFMEVLGLGDTKK